MSAQPTEHRLARSSAIVGIGTLLSRTTGFVRVSTLAALGFARLTDVYNVSNSIPNIVYELVLGGTLTATLVPLYVEHLKNNDRRASDAINTVAIVALAVITVLGVIAAPWIIDLYMARLGNGDSVEQQRELSTQLLRLFMPQMFFYGITALATGMLNARRRFAAAAFAPVLNNIAVIAVLLTLPRVASAPPSVDSVLDDPWLVLLLGIGTTAGVLAMALVLLPALGKAGAGFRWVWEWRHPAVRKLARLSSWTIGYVASNQVAFLVVLFLAYAKSGDTSVYLAAFMFFQLPHGLFAVSIMTALAPELARHSQDGDIDGLRDAFCGGFRLMGLAVIPSAVLLGVLAKPIVNALLNYGSFTDESATLTSETLTAFVIGLFFFSAYLFTLRGFYAMQDTRTPFLLNVFESILNIVLALALYPSLGVQGLALSWSISYGLGAVATLVVMRARLSRLDGRRIGASLLRVTLASAVLGVIAYLVANAIGYGTSGQAILATVGAAIAGGAAFFGVLLLLRHDELGALKSVLMPAGRADPTPRV